MIAMTLLGISLAACGSDGSGAVDDSDVQSPPTSGREDMERWLARGDYKSWASEAAIHDARSPSPHGFNRIYSNSLIATGAVGTADWPEGSAAVKELYDSATAATPIGFAVYRKIAADSNSGINWYWYERLPTDSEVPHDANGVVANSLGDEGGARDICVSCHIAAGTDVDHTPSMGGRDLVYTPVM